MAQREAASQAVLETHITLSQHQVTAKCCFNGGGKSPKVGCRDGISLMEKDIEIPSGERKASHITQHILCMEDQECRAQGANIPFNTPVLAAYCVPGSIGLRDGDIGSYLACKTSSAPQKEPVNPQAWQLIHCRVL